MEINKKLNLVIPLYDAEGQTITSYVHVTPVSRAVFDKFYLVFAKTFAAIYGEGLGAMAGPRIAAKLLLTVADSLGSAQEVSSELVTEMRRNTMFIKAGQPNMMLEDAIRGNLVSEDDVEEVDNATAFFTVASLILPKIDRKKELALFSKLWGASTTSSSSMEFAASLKTSTEPVTTGANQTTSSVPH